MPLLRANSGCQVCCSRLRLSVKLRGKNFLSQVEEKSTLNERAVAKKWAACPSNEDREWLGR
jgi:hypothetical protein